MAQYGFYFNMDVCIGCSTCQVACKDRNNLDIGTVYRVVDHYETGEFPNTGIFHVSRSCNHCADPACVAACPTEAMFRDEETGVVLLNVEECIGCKACVEECPYDVPQYFEEEQVVGKCDSCISQRNAGELPACVGACPMRALDFDEVDKLKEKYGDDLVSEFSVTPSADITVPSTLVKLRDTAKEDTEPVKIIY